MTRKFLTLAAGALMLGASAVSAQAAGKTICMSWKTYQEERWKTDEAAIKAVLDAAGDKFITTDAQLSAQKQAADIESLLTQGCDVIMLVAFDADAILPSIQKMNDAGAKVIAYDVQVEDPNALYITFDNVGVGRIIATEVQKVKPEGDYAFIKGLWSDWSPGYDHTTDVEYFKASVPDPQHLAAALGYYRATFQPDLRSPDLHEWDAAGAKCPSQPTLYMHGVDDGCIGIEVADGLEADLADGSAVNRVEGAGHFLHLERPDIVNAAIVGFLRS